GATHLAIAEHVQARPLLVPDGQLGGVLQGLPHVRGAIRAGLDLLQGRPEPAGEPVAPDDVRVHQRQWRQYPVLPTERLKGSTRPAMLWIDPLLRIPDLFKAVSASRSLPA